MEIYTVSFFGHRQVHNPIQVAEALKEKIREIIITNDYVDFLVGRNGAFDLMAASMVRRVRKELDYGNCSLVLALPHMTKEYRDNKGSFEKYYDDIEICAEAERAHFKGAYQIRNRMMIDRSDLVICYIEHKSGGAFQTVEYAGKRKVEICNIAVPISE